MQYLEGLYRPGLVEATGVGPAHQAGPAASSWVHSQKAERDAWPQQQEEGQAVK
jgi:hypothetical protein